MRPVNLLPEGDRPYVPTGARAGSAYAVVGLLGALALVAVVYGGLAYQIDSRTARAQTASREADKAEARASALGPFGAFAQIKQTRFASVTQLAEGRFDWERMLREMSLVLPDGVFLTELGASTTDEATGSGAGGSDAANAPPSAAGAAGAGGPASTPSMTLTGCAPTQPVVATTLVRLRRLNRAESVELGESSRPESSGGSAGAAPPAPGGGAGTADAGECGETDGRPNYSFTVTVKFSPAQAAGATAANGATGAPEPKVPANLGGGK